MHGPRRDDENELASSRCLVQRQLHDATSPRLLVVVLDSDLLRVDRRLTRRHVHALVDHLVRRLALRLLVDGVACAVDLGERLGLGGGERASFLGLERLEVALGDGVDLVLDLEERGEGKRLRVGVPRSCVRVCASALYPTSDTRAAGSEGEAREREADARIWTIPWASHSSCVGAVLAKRMTSPTSTSPLPFFPTCSRTQA